jgi:hypothetical protein
MKWVPLGVAIGLLLFTEHAYGVWFRSESIEWQTNVSDIVAIAEVTSVQEIELADQATKTSPSRTYFRSQTITCSVSRTDKGKPRDSFSFRQNYRRDPRLRASDDRPLRPKDRLLLFAVEKPVWPDKNVIFWVNLTRPDVVESPHAAYNNDCKWLGDADPIIKTVEGRIDAERKGTKTKQRGLIVEFTAAPHEDLHWEFVRTADPECKPGLIKQLHNSQFPDEKELAMYNLISYPGHETIKIILPFLRDPTRTTTTDVVVGVSGKPISKTQEISPLRQSAYFALIHLGALPQKPEGFSPNWQSWHSATGFESRIYFPYGEWQRTAE